MYLLGYDLGSSSIKAALIKAGTHEVIKTVQYPPIEMDILAEKQGWAEQQPEVWWQNVCIVTKNLLKETQVDPNLIFAIGISYQMHGLVLIDKKQQVLRPSIIWCDSRAVEIGEKAIKDIGEEKCLSHLLNSPGNFTLSKLKWVKDNEPHIYDKINKFLLPGDFLAMKLTGEVNTTVSGLSEGILWDFKKDKIANFALENFEIDKSLVPDIVPTFHQQGKLQRSAAELLGLPKGIPITYRAGDQPNNAMALGVTKPGQVAATGGTSGVVYGISDQPKYDEQQRVNSFAHVNHKIEGTRIGVLLCINGAGIQYSWLKKQIAAENTTYSQMEEMIGKLPVGSEQLTVLPFGNGAERILHNKNLGSHIVNLHFNKHSKAHLYRAALEGVAFAFVYGMKILNELDISTDLIRVGNDNLFQSPVFSTTISTLIGATIEVLDTNGAIGAAKAAEIALENASNLEAIFQDIHKEKIYEPQSDKAEYIDAYQSWEEKLKSILNR